MTFSRIIDAVESYAESEGKETWEVMNEITEHFIPGIDEIFTDEQLEGVLLQAFETVQ